MTDHKHLRLIAALSFSLLINGMLVAGMARFTRNAVPRRQTVIAVELSPRRPVSHVIEPPHFVPPSRVLPPAHAAVLPGVAPTTSTEAHVLRNPQPVPSSAAPIPVAAYFPAQPEETSLPPTPIHLTPMGGYPSPVNPVTAAPGTGSPTPVAPPHATTVPVNPVPETPHPTFISPAPATPVAPREVEHTAPPPPPPIHAEQLPLPAASIPAPAPHGERRGARVVQNTQPAYPREARDEGREGTVVLRVTLDAQARVTGVELLASAGDRRLDRAAERAVRDWTFAPALEEGKPVEASLRVRVQFRLE